MQALFLTIFLALVALCSAESRIHSHLFNRWIPPPPITERSANTRSVSTEWISVPVDHFAKGNTSYFPMRYMTNGQFFVKDGSPIFILLGGEWAISAAWLMGGNMFVTARDLGGYMVYTEHRYYGHSRPAPNTEASNLKYLIVDQALADVIDVIKSLKSQPRFAKSKVIVIGGSYAGNMATWIRLQYPKYIDGAISSSAPVLAQADFFEYMETVNDALTEYGGNKCVKAINKGIKQTKKSIKNGQLSEVQAAYNLCSPINHKNKLDVQGFFTYVVKSFTSNVQKGTPASLQALCNRLLSHPGNELEKLGKHVREYVYEVTGGTNCYDIKYNETIQYFQDTSYLYANVYETRAWMYQLCTEYGFFQTTNSKWQPFEDVVPVSYYADHFCPDLFGAQYDANRLAAGIKRTNKLYRGMNPKVTKVFTVHGSIDPWHRLGIWRNLKESPYFMIKDTAHCVDLQAPSINDVPGLVEARRLMRESILEWIKK